MHEDSLGFFHGTRVGRTVLGVLTLVLVVSLVVWNLPEGDYRDGPRERVEPVIDLLVINQGWGVFAPNPTRTSARVAAEVTYDDGTIETYDFPDGEPFIGALREYRWRKIERRLRQDDYRSLWRPTAEWIATELSTDDRSVVQVDLIRHQARTPDAGSGDPLTWKIERIHTFEPVDSTGG